MKNKKVYVGATSLLMFGALALAPVLPMPFTATNVYAVEGTNVEVSTYSELYETIVNGTASTVTLRTDITEMRRAMVVPAGRVVTIDLNGFALMVGNGAERAITNYGDLTVTNGVMRNSDVGMENNSKGIFDNFGTLTIKNVTLEDYGSHTASTIRNNYNDSKVNFLLGSRIHLLSTEKGNVGIAAAKGEVFIDDGTEIISNSLMNGYYPVQIKDGKVTIGTEGSGNPARIQSKSVGIYLYGTKGELTVNNVEINSENKGIYVETNNAKVTINKGKFFAPYGGVYVFTTTRRSQPLVTINDGEFSGRWASIMSTNGAGDLESWAFDIRGGVFAGSRVRDYISSDYKAYRVAEHFENGWAGYFVRPAAQENVPDTIFLKKGTENIFGLSANAQQFATVTMDKDGVVVLEGNTLKANRTGIVTVVTDFNDGSEPVTTIVYAYDNLLSAAFMAADRFDAEIIAALDAKMEEGENRIGYLDVNYARVIDGVSVEEIEEVTTPVTVLVELPELPRVAEGYERSYRVWHYVDGVVEEVAGAKVNPATGTLAFETTTFEPFLVTYTDTLIPVEEPGEDEGDPSKPNKPVQGDPEQPEIVKPDDTFDYDDPGETDPLGEVFTKPPVVTTGGNSGASGATVKVPNTASTEDASEINLLTAMMIGAFATTGAMVVMKKRTK